ncbi:MAG: hypothetical protein ACLQNE_21445 [Thermoguttaceae bacterium]
MTVTTDFLSGLYNRESCYADRLTAEQLDAIHVPTPLERSLRKWILKRNDLVIAGNPGDGKTHLFMRLKDVLKKVQADVILDATSTSWRLSPAKTRRPSTRPTRTVR